MGLLRRSTRPALLVWIVCLATVAAGLGVVPSSAAAEAPTAADQAPKSSFVAGVSQERPDLRDEFSRTYVNPDGTRTTKMAPYPLNYRNGEAWVPIDSKIIPDALPGTLRTTANRWTARFGPTGLRLEDGSDAIVFAPIGGQPVVPSASADGSSVTYAQVWPGVDIKYTAYSFEVKEEIVFHRRPDRNVFSFATGGVALESDPGAAGGLRPVGALGARWRVPPATVLDKRRSPISSPVATLAASGQGLASRVEVRVDGAWLDSLDADDYPIVVDPTLRTGADGSQAYRGNGENCIPCPIVVGNPDTSWATWRGMVHFPYESLYGKKVTYAQIDLWNLFGGTSAAYPMSVYHATAFDWPSLGQELIYRSYGGDGSYGYNLSGGSLTSFYDWLTRNYSGGAWLKFIGEENDPNWYTYKELHAFELQLDWADRPSPPTNVVATRGNGSASVSWTAPNNNGSAITSYTVTASPGGQTSTVGGGSTSTTVGGLANGTSYTFTVRAANDVGTSDPSAPSNAVTPATTPGVPAGVTATRGNASANVSWSAPSSNGGSAITGYTVTASPGGQTATTTGATATVVSGLTNGTSYTFTVRATNSVGTGSPSSPSNAVTPATVPGAPTNVVATRGNAEASITWTAPASNGGSAITGYTVTASPGGQTATTAGATNAVVTGLTNGTSYTFTVHATNAVGNSAPSAPSNAVTPATVPNAPTNATATRGDTSASVSWTAPSSNGGSPITGYTVTASPGGRTATVGGGSTSAVVTGLTNGTSYTFTVHATNAVGNSAPSSPSNAVTPATVAGAPTNVMATAGNASASISWSAPANGGATITGYRVTASPGGQTATVNGTTTTATATGLTNGTSYTFTVVALNAVGEGPASAPSNAVTPATVPGAPTGANATRGNASATVTWTAPSSNGGSVIQTYTVTASPGGAAVTVNAPATSATVTGLTNGTSYTFTVYATNAVGNGPASSPSNAVTPATVPGAPTNVWATNGEDQASTVTWTAPPANGSPITGYTATASPGGATVAVGGAATSARFTGLTNGTSYTFTVLATNAIGTGAWSAPSNAITPTNQPPNIVDATPYPDPVAANETLTFAVEWNSSPRAVRTYICKKADGGVGGCGAAGTWASSGFTNNNPVYSSYQTTAADVGRQLFYAYICDDLGRCAPPTLGSFTVVAVNLQAVCNVSLTPTLAATATGAAIGTVLSAQPASQPGTKSGVLYSVQRRALLGGTVPDKFDVFMSLPVANGLLVPSAGQDYVFYLRQTADERRMDIAFSSTSGAFGIEAVPVGTPAVCSGPNPAPPLPSTNPPPLPQTGGVPPTGALPPATANCSGDPADDRLCASPAVPADGSLRALAITSTPRDGQWLVASDGGIFTFGDAQFLGSMGGSPLNQPMTCMASSATGNGYWQVAGDGGIFTFGDAAFHGSTGNLRLNKPIIGMASSPTGGGYWLVATDGGIFTFGDATFWGSTGNMPLNKPIVGMAATPSGQGYWLVASDGGIFSFGDAVFYGSTGGIALNSPITGIAVHPSGTGYWLVAADGGIFAFGGAVFQGSAGASRLNAPVVGITTSPTGNGYYMTARDGSNFAFGDAQYRGSLTGTTLNKPVIGIAGVGRPGSCQGIVDSGGASPAVGGSAAGFNYFQQPTPSGSSHDRIRGWRCATTYTYAVNQNHARAADVARVHEVMADIAGRTNIRWTFGGYTTETPTSNNRQFTLYIAFQTPSEDPRLRGNAGIGGVGHNGGPYFTSGEAVFNADSLPSGRAIDWELVAHELGHAQGLEHVDGQVMAARTTGFTNWRSGDINGLGGACRP